MCVIDCVHSLQALKLTACSAGGAVYLFFMSRRLATAVAGVTALLWIVALRYGNFSRKAQRTYQDALAETNQVRAAEVLDDNVSVHDFHNAHQAVLESRHIGQLSVWCPSFVFTQTMTTATAAQFCSLVCVYHSYYT